MYTLESVSDAQIAEADVITAHNPDTSGRHQLCGQDSVSPSSAPGIAASEVKTLDIELPPSDNTALLGLINRVEKIRGRVPLDVQRLRDKLLARPTALDWSPITDLPDDWESSLRNPQTTALVQAWHEQAGELREQELYKEFLAKLQRQWAIETGVLEGLYTISEGATLALIEKGLDASLISHGDTDDSPENVFAKIRDQHHAIMGLYQFISGNRELGTSYVKELHCVLTAHQETYTGRDTLGNLVTRELPKGEWKKLKNNVEHPDGTVFEYCPPEHVEHEMDNMIAMHRNHDSLDVPPDVEAAWLHHRFTLIHPFTDGNGRVARCLATLVLLKANWLPLVIDRKDRESYIAALRSADVGNLKPLVDLFGTLQRKSILEALSISEQVIHEAAKLQGILSAAKAKFAKRREAHTELISRAFRTADSLQVMTRQRLDEVAAEVDTAICNEGPNFKSYVSHGERESERAGYNYHQIIDTAKALDYFANLQLYQAWAALVVRTDQRSEILFAFHGIGHAATGVLGCSAMFYTKKRTEDDDMVVGDLAPLVDEPFEFTYVEDSVDVQNRFRHWLEDKILQGLEQWQKLA